MNKFLILVLTSVLLAGCTGKVYLLEDKWAPLKNVKEMSLTREGFVHTVTPTVYVKNLDEWLVTFPEGSVERDLLLTHERVHAYRQKKQGLASWLADYALDADFRWNEERLAVYAAMLRSKELNYTMDLNWYAEFLSGSGYFYMISYEGALQWLQEAWQGSWKAPEGSLPK